MNKPPTPGEILRDIEFEIIQGALGQDDLGQGVQAARRFHSQSRRRLLDGDAQANGREVALRQFQISEMLLVLIQELATQLRRLQVELRKTAGLLPERPPGTRLPEVDTAAGSTKEIAVLSTPNASREAASYPPTATRALGRLQVEAQVKPVRLPLVGRLLTRLRTTLHSLPLYYVQQLAGQQMEINRALSESLDQLGCLLAEQQAQIQALSQKLQALQAQANHGRSEDPG